MEQTSRLSIVIDTGNAQRDLQNLRRALADLEGSSGRAVGGVQRLDGSLQSISRGFGVLKGVIGALGLGMTVGSIISTADSMQTLNNQLRLATGSAEKFGIVMENIERIAMENKVSLQSVGEMYVSNERALKQLGKGQQEVLRFTENVTKAMAVGGGSAQAQAAALTQLGQAMASGVLRGDEFNSIAEQAPMIMELMADSLNVTTGELRKMAGEGKLTAEAVYQALTSAEASQKLGAMTGQTATTVAGALQVVKNQWDIAVNKFMNGENGISQSLANIIIKFSDIIPKVVEFGQAFAGSEAWQGAIAGVGTAFEVAGLAIGNALAVLTPIGAFIAEHSELVLALSTGLLAGATAYGVITLAMGAFATASTAVATAGGVMNLVMATATGVMGAFGVVMAVITSPITLAVVAIGALAAAGVYLYRNWEEASDIIGGTIEQIVLNFYEFRDGITMPVTDAIESTVNAFNDLKSQGIAAVTAFKDGAVAKFNEFKNTAKSIFDGLPAPIKTQLSVIGNLFSTQFALIKNIVSTVFNTIKALVRGDMEGVKNAISNGIQNAWNIVRTGVGNIVREFAGLGAKLKQAGIDAIQGLINGISSKFQAVREKVSQIAGLIPDGVRSLLNIRSPSRVMRELGGYVGEGLALGIKDKQNDVKKQAEELANTVKSAFSDLHKQAFMLENANDPLAEAKYRTQFGDLSGASDGDKSKYLDMTKSLQDFADLQERSKAVTNNINDLQRQIALFDDNSALAQLNYDIEHTGKYTGIAQSELDKLKSHMAELSTLQANKQASDKALNDFNNLSNNTQLLSPADKLLHEFNRQKEIISEFKRWHIDQEVQANKKLDELNEQYQTARTDLMLQTYENGFGAVAGMMKSAFGEQSGIYKAMFAMEKGYALARVLLANKESIAKAWASAPFPRNLPVVASTIIQTGALQSAISAINPVIGQAHDGIMSVPKSGTWNLEKGERVLPKHTAKALDDRLDNMGGGQVINVHVTVNSDGSNVQADTQIGRQMGEAMAKIARQVMMQETKQNGHLDRLYRR